MTEMEKCRAGQNYNCHDKIFLELKRNARELLTRYNGLSYCQILKNARYCSNCLATMCLSI